MRNKNPLGIKKHYSVNNHLKILFLGFSIKKIHLGSHTLDLKSLEELSMHMMHKLSLNNPEIKTD
jgi:hypothetical protein